MKDLVVKVKDDGTDIEVISYPEGYKFLVFIAVPIYNRLGQLFRATNMKEIEQQMTFTQAFRGDTHK